MTLEKHKEAIIRWAKSCVTSEQLDLLRDIVKRFIENTFSTSWDELDKKIVLSEIKEVIADQEKLIASNPAIEIPTLAYQKQ